GVTSAYDSGRGFPQTGSFSANGARSLQNNYMIDGIDNNAEIDDLQNQTQYVVLPPPDALTEFTVETNNYSAQFGHAEGAVLNAETKSGSNQLRGDLWEFLRNDKLDAADFFLNAGGAQKAELRENQFGFTLGGPLVVPRLYNGRNKTFWFGYYQGTRIVSGNRNTPTVPTAGERASGYTNFQDLIAGQTGIRTDALGRVIPTGTILDPATTRAVTKGVMDPVTGLSAMATGSVRDPFYQGSLRQLTNFATPAIESLLNVIPATRLDPNAIKLLNLYPLPSVSGVFNNYVDKTVNTNHNNLFGARADHYFNERDTIFVRWVLSNTSDAHPGPFPGLADGQANRPASGTADAQNWAVSETHTFSSNLVNEARAGYSRLHSLLAQYTSNDLSNIPAQFGIPGIPQVPGNGGLPLFTIGSLHTLGQPAFLPADKWSNTFQATENLTKIAGAHTLTTGAEFQNVRWPDTTPPSSRGQFTYNGAFTSVVNQTDGSTGIAQFLLTPIASTVPGGVNNVGGMNQLQATNFPPVADFRRNYYALYGQDNWRITSKLTLTLGLRWEYFARPAEHYGAIANVVPGLNFQGGTFLVPSSRAGEVPQAYINQLALDGIKFEPTSGAAWERSPDRDFGPRFGFAYRAKPNLVVRGAYAIFYGGYQTLGRASTGTNNFPFLVQSNFQIANPTTPLSPNNSIGLLENGMLNVPLSAATATNLSGISLLGAEPDWKDAASQNYNFSLQYQLPRATTFKAAYVGSQTRHQLTTAALNTVATILPPGTNIKPYLFYPDFGQGGTYTTARGNSHYNALQANLEHRSGNLYMLSNFTWASCRTNSDEGLVVDAGPAGTQVAPYLAGFGPQYANCVDGGIRRIFHFSGVYTFPFGRGQRFLNNSRIVDYVLGGWSTNWILTVHDGQPFNIGCAVSTTQGLGCNALLVPGQSLYAGQQTPGHFLNAAAFANPPVATAIGQTDFTPLGGEGVQVAGPPLRNIDFSLFKAIPMTESTRLEFRAECFNLANTPNFAVPSFTSFINTSTFGKITGTVGNPREIQFALKLYF
ncbi:MAG: TonB-dependent receptor, partial [Acidobacteriaceae bacterium]|nr:TonB-dependent receptor [Acidobacteriaceae bacterium]